MIEERLINWARCMRGPVGGPHRPICKSSERNYPGWHNPTQPAQIEWLYKEGKIDDQERFKLYEAIPKPMREKLLPRDVLDAMNVERAWALMQSRKNKKLLQLFYVKRWPVLLIARKLKLQGDFQTFLLLAHNLIEVTMNYVENKIAHDEYPSMHNLIPYRYDDLRFAGLEA